MLNPRTECRLDLGDPREDLLEPPPRLDRVPADAPEVAHRAHEPQLSRQVALGTRGVEGRADVRELGLDPIEPVGTTRPIPRLAVVAREGDGPRELPASKLVALLAARKLDGGVGANGLEHHEARLGAAFHRRDREARVQERVERRGHVGLRLRDRLQRLERRSAWEHGERSQHVPRGRIEQLDAPGDGRAKRPLPLR